MGILLEGLKKLGLIPTRVLSNVGKPAIANHRLKARQKSLALNSVVIYGDHVIHRSDDPVSHHIRYPCCNFCGDKYSTYITFSYMNYGRADSDWACRKCFDRLKDNNPQEVKELWLLKKILPK